MLIICSVGSGLCNQFSGFSFPATVGFTAMLLVGEHYVQVWPLIRTFVREDDCSLGPANLLAPTLLCKA